MECARCYAAPRRVWLMTRCLLSGGRSCAFEGAGWGWGRKAAAPGIDARPHMRRGCGRSCLHVRLLPALFSVPSAPVVSSSLVSTRLHSTSLFPLPRRSSLYNCFCRGPRLLMRPKRSSHTPPPTVHAPDVSAVRIHANPTCIEGHP